MIIQQLLDQLRSYETYTRAFFLLDQRLEVVVPDDRGHDGIYITGAGV